MNPIITSISGIIATLTGACAILLMLELRSNPRKDSRANQRLIKAHKVTGYIFIAFFIVISAVMLSKAGTFQEEFSPRTILHISLALLVIPLLFFKILIIRRFKRFEKQIPGIGLAVFLALFLLNSMTAGYYFLHQSLQRSDIGKLSSSEEDAAVSEEKKGQKLVAQKCGKCHALERIFKALKSDQGWTETVNRMVSYDTPNISDSEGKQILAYLISQQKRREKLAFEMSGDKSKRGRNLVEQKCSFCHGLERIYLAEKTREEWMRLAEKMIGYSEQMEFLSSQEKEAVIEFLSSRSSSRSEDAK